MEIRDPVHGFVDLWDGERAVVDTPAFQRLRRIRQLAMADLAYPGAVHHRFEHSIGVCHIAGRIADRLMKGEPDRIKYIRMAALVHDIGHGPFSHVSEEPLAVVNRQWLEREKIPRDKVHEIIGLDIVKHRLLDTQTIDRNMFQRVRSILDTVHYPHRTIERDIVSGPLDVDKMDYLLRDSLFCGVKYGAYDLERLIRALAVISQKDEEFVGVNAEDVAVVDQYVIARYNMFMQVYSHKVRRATDLVLTRAILKAIESKDEKIVNAYTYRQGDNRFVEEYLRFDDRVLLYFLLNSKSDATKGLAGRLVYRLLPKRICYRPIREIRDAELRRQLIDTKQRNVATEKLRQQLIEGFPESNPDCIFVEIVDSKPVGKFYELSEGDLGQIMVQSPQWKRPRALHYVSSFFKDYKFAADPIISIYMEVPLYEKEKVTRRAKDVLNDLFDDAEEADDVTEQR